MYKEWPPPPPWRSLLVGIFLLLTIPNVWLPELTTEEAVNALMARDIHDQGQLANVTLMGRQTVHPPMMAWLLAFWSFFVPLNELTIRLVGIAALAGLAFLCGRFAFRAAGLQAGLATGAACASCFAALQKGPSGEEGIVFALLINGSWLTWYYLSRERRKWLFAWFFAHLLMLLALLTVGPKAVFYFYFPLIFLRRPLGSWRRLRHYDHLLSLLFVVVAVTVWLAMVPNLAPRMVGFFQNFEPRQATVGYLGRLFLFPWRVAWGYFPWIFLAWPAFCIAFRPLERSPTLAKFLRTIVLSLFLFFWLLPGGKASDLLPLIGPLSILLGLNYAILVRRYGDQLLLLARVCCWGTVAVTVGAGIIALVVMVRGTVFAVPDVVVLSSAFFLFLGFGLALTLIRLKVTVPIWLMIVSSVLALHMAYSATFTVYGYVAESGKRNVGRRLAQHLPPKQKVYELIGGDEIFPAECFYLNREVQRVESTEGLPRGPEEVYVLGNNLIPISPDRDWEPVSPTIPYRDYLLRVWKGTRR